MQGAGKWIVGGLVALLGVIALFVASEAHDSEMYLFGLIFFAAAVIFIFLLIGHHAGRHERQG